MRSNLTTSPFGVRALRAAYREGTLTPHQVVDEVLARIAARDDDAVWITLVPAADLRARADELAAHGPDGLPLYGVPFAVKNNIDVAGLPTTAACPAFAYTPTVDATSVRLLRAAGAIVVGTTNLDQFATGLTGSRSPYGAGESVFGGDLISGGSSSGSAVAVAAGQVAFALGTDTAGSGRVPAAMNGIVGLKPTRGLVSTTGVVPACRSLDCVSVFATTLDDAADVLAVLAAPDPTDPWSRRPHPPRVHDTVGPPSDHRTPRVPHLDTVSPAFQHDQPRRVPHTVGPRLALAEPGALDFDGDDAMADAFSAVAHAAARSAAETVPIPIAPLLEAGDLLYTGPWVAERLAGLEAFLAAHPDDVLPVTRAVIEKGADFSAVDAFRARHRLQELRAWCDRLWERADVLLLPTVPTTFTRAQIAEQPMVRNLVLGRFTQFTNLLDLAAVAVPAGFTPDGRPVGVTVLGPAFSEDRLLSAAHQLITREAA